MILEAIVSTVNPEGQPNFAPMGVHLDDPSFGDPQANPTYRNLTSATGGTAGATPCTTADVAKDNAPAAPPQITTTLGLATPGAELVRLRPYRGSHTYANLQATREGVISFTDNVLIFVETALFSSSPPHAPSHLVRAPRLAEASLAWEFSVTDFDASLNPAQVEARIEHRWGQPAGLGFCRAHLALIEAAIAATRWQWIDQEELRRQWPSWERLVHRTGGPREEKALGLIRRYLEQRGLPP